MSEVSVTVSDAAGPERAALEPILAESFEGWYLRHSTRTLKEIGLFRVARVGGAAAGLTMLKTLETGDGYVYYVAVAREFRRKGVASRLLDDAMEGFARGGSKAAYASVENEAATKLFGSKGFRRTDFMEMRREHGVVRAIALYRSMLVVPGEVLLRADVGASPSSRA